MTTLPRSKPHRKGAIERRVLDQRDKGGGKADHKPVVTAKHDVNGVVVAAGCRVRHQGSCLRRQQRDRDQHHSDATGKGR